jgi:uncharacterized protein YcbX
MDRITITNLFVHPVKGLSPVARSRVQVERARGIPGDRTFALLFADVEADRSSRAVPFLKKQCLAVQADWPGLAALRCDVDPATGRFVVHQGDEKVLDVDASGDRSAIDAFFTRYLTTLMPARTAKHPTSAPVTLIGAFAAATRYPDRVKFDVSLLNRASLRALEDAAGAPIDVRRFRGNIVVDGLAPWAELSLVGRHVQCGEAVVRIDEAIGRCANVDVDPDTGDTALAVLRAVGRSPGKGCFGMVATVVTPGAVTTGDRVQVLD